jgi:spermidine synthase
MQTAAKADDLGPVVKQEPLLEWPLHPYFAQLIVFVASAATMVVELVAGRIMAPYIGVSLYTWTSIIGVVLAGMSLGNYLGGKLADRAASRLTLALIFFASALSCLAILVLTELIMGSGLEVPLPLVPRIVFFTTIIFFTPACLLGFVSPIVVKLTLRDLSRTGSIVGRIYAFSTAGSIVGTFLTGFVLVEHLGTRAIIWLVAAVLILLGVIAGQFWRRRDTLLAFLGVLAIYGGLFTQRDLFAAPCHRETSYFCIRISESQIDGRPVRAMVLDHLVHSYTSLEDPTFLGYGYERVYAEVLEYYAQGRSNMHLLFIGGGGYTFPRYAGATYPDAHLDVVEIDPGVTEMAHRYFDLDKTRNLTSFNMDARLFYKEYHAQIRGKYDAAFGDAFNDLAIPYHLTTVEFNQMIRASLKPDGVYMANVIDNYKTGEFMRAYANTLRRVWPYVYLLSQGEAWHIARANTYVLLATNQPFDREAFYRTLERGGRPVYTRMLDDATFAQYLAQGRQIIFTDEYAPADNLVAPLFLERGY